MKDIIKMKKIKNFAEVSLLKFVIHFSSIKILFDLQDRYFDI